MCQKLSIFYLMLFVTRKCVIWFKSFATLSQTRASNGCAVQHLHSLVLLYLVFVVRNVLNTRLSMHVKLPNIRIKVRRKRIRNRDPIKKCRQYTCFSLFQNFKMKCLALFFILKGFYVCCTLWAFWSTRCVQKILCMELAYLKHN